MPQPITNLIIGVLPQEGDSSLIRESLRGQDLELELVRSPEAALDLLAWTPASVILYDADTGQPWRDALRCFLAVRPGVRVVSGAFEALAEDEAVGAEGRIAPCVRCARVRRLG